MAIHSETLSREAALVVPHIGPESFPTPRLAYTFGPNPSEEEIAILQRRESFAYWHADLANAVLAELDRMTEPPSAGTWTYIYHSIIAARAEQDVSDLRQSSVVYDRASMLTPITDDMPNYDRLGTRRQSYYGAVFDPALKTYVGGEPTPASDVREDAGRRALERFTDPTVDVLQNKVRLFNGRTVNGNIIVRGAAAQECSGIIRERIKNRGFSVEHYDVGATDKMYTITASASDRAMIFSDVMLQLSKLRVDVCTPESLAQIAYELYQSPQNKKGSDAVIRTFLVVAGTYIMRCPPILREDIDFCAYTQQQDVFVREMADCFTPNGT